MIGHNPNFVFPLLFFIIFLCAGCREEVEFPIPENQFCAAIEEGRESYAEVGTINNPSDAQQLRKEVRQQRKQEMITILPEGKIFGWHVQMTNVPTKDHMTEFELKLPCHDAFLVVTNIRQDPDLLNQISKVQSGRYVVVFGILTPASLNGLDAFQELSATESESMDQPRFAFHLVSVLDEKKNP